MWGDPIIVRKFIQWLWDDPIVVSRAGEPEPEPLDKKPGAGAAWKKKSGAGAVAAKKLAGSSDLREDKKHKEIVL